MRARGGWIVAAVAVVAAAVAGPLRFLEAYQARYKRPATTYAEQGYVGAQLIARAMELTKGNVENREALLAALEKVEIEAPRGPLRLDAYHNVELGRTP